MRRTRRSLLALGGALASGCVGRSTDANTTSGLRLACGTTVYETGLADELTAVAAADGIGAEILPRGTGAALRTARDGDADAVLVHHPAAERAFVSTGPGIDRRPVMYNDFLLVGPEDDPARVAAASTVVAAFERLAENDATFLSRGDDSGTNARERRIWGAAMIEPAGEWYRETGAGMGETLRMAAASDAYTLVDRGTFRVVGETHRLSALFVRSLDDPPELLRNRYSVIRVDPRVHPHVAADAAADFAAFLTGSAGQRVIETYRAGGDRLFVPASGRDAD
ncbi:substrate-binding domain-containing protein [Haloferacaceae archaeon DSL9]